MPIVSRSQQKWAYANKDKEGPEGQAAADFVAAGPKGGSFASLPEKVGKKENAQTGQVLKRSFQSLMRSKKHGA